MGKIDTKIRYLCQDLDGAIHASIENKPYPKDGWIYCDMYYIRSGKKNQNWRDTLIDLDVDDYDFEDGILRRIEK